MAEYILDTTDGIYNARTTGELVRCRDCVFMEMRQLFGGIDAKCYLDPEFQHLRRAGRLLLEGGEEA